MLTFTFRGREVEDFLEKFHWYNEWAGVSDYDFGRPRRELHDATIFLKGTEEKLERHIQALERRLAAIESLPRPPKESRSADIRGPIPERPGKITRAWTRFSQTRVARETYAGFWEGWRKYLWTGLLLLLGLLAERCEWIDILPNP